MMKNEKLNLLIIILSNKIRYKMRLKKKKSNLRAILFEKV